MTTIATSVALGEVQTSPKGAIVWQSAWTHVLWEPSSFGEDQGPRQNACLAMERDSEAWAAWEEFEKRCVNELSSRSSRIWGDYGDVKDRWQSCLKESRQGATFLKCKLDAWNVRF